MGRGALLLAAWGRGPRVPWAVWACGAPLLAVALWGLAVLAPPAGAQGLRAEDLSGCYVGAEPCGGPTRMAALIARCARDPDACGWLELRRSRPGAGPEAAVAPSPARALPAPVAPQPNGAVAPTTIPTPVSALPAPAALPTGSPGAAERPDRTPRGGPSIAGAAARDLGPAAAAPSSSTEARIAALLRALPLPGSVLDLSDRLPADPAAVERALGLRRPEGGRIVDLRDAAAPPSTAEILRALRDPGPGS